MTFLTREVVQEDLAIELSSNMLFRDYHYAENDNVLVTTSNEYIDRAVLVTAGLSGDYRLSWQYNWNSDSTSSNFECTIYHVQGDINISEHIEEAKDSSGSYLGTNSGQKLMVSGFKKLSLVGAHTFVMKFRSSKKNKAASIWNARLELMRV